MKKYILVICCVKIFSSDLGYSLQVDFTTQFLSNPNVKKFAEKRNLKVERSSITTTDLSHLFNALRKIGRPALEKFSYEDIEREFAKYMVDFTERQFKVAALNASKWLPHDKMLEIIAASFKQ